MTSVNTGQAAEQIASGWLQEQGFRILDRNWRTRWCELDIVAEQEGIVRIIEVKYRRRSDFGTGFEYITPDKVRRLQRAAQMWLAAHSRPHQDYAIDIIAISGPLSSHNLEYLPDAIEG